MKNATTVIPVSVFLLYFLTILFFTITIHTTNATWIDIDTPIEKRTTQSLVDGTTYDLVMSDEFNVNGRNFKDGNDPLWTALDKSDDDASSVGGGSLHFYNSSNVITEDGYLKISTFLQKTEWNRYDHVNKEWKKERTNFTSGMMQSWNKFCFTGGIVEMDIIFPGEPYIGGLWPAVWMLGNLGRATYEASTNNIWPWSYNHCDRAKQKSQTISACDEQSHYGMKPFVGRGATEIDIVEVMTGTLTGGLPGTEPSIDYPYCDFTLQLAPGVVDGRPQNGHQPLRQNILASNGYAEFVKDTWYEGLEMNGNTSVNPFFYGTYLAETKPNEPVSRSKEQAFQADAVGAAHQLTPSHFQKPHTFRLEWQPGQGGRLDWYVKGYKTDINGNITYTEGDGEGKEWVLAYSVKDESLKQLMGSQIPIEPTYLIMNVAVSSTWGFPYDVPEFCPKCYDCDDPKCQCSFYPGFCQMVRSGRTAMYIDYLRVYQSSNDSAHVGAPHTLGCDPPEYPTKEWINGHEYRYMRNPPFSFLDKHPLRKTVNGGGQCRINNDCGANVSNINYTAIYEREQEQQEPVNNDMVKEYEVHGRGTCQVQTEHGLFSFVGNNGPTQKICVCKDGFTGPNCLSQAFNDEATNILSASALSRKKSPFSRISHFKVPHFMLATLFSATIILLYILLSTVQQNKQFRAAAKLASSSIRAPLVGSSITSNGGRPRVVGGAPVTGYTMSSSRKVNPGYQG